MTDRQARRVAWAASAGAHGLLIAGVWVLTPATPPVPPDPDRDVVLTMTLVEPDEPPQPDVPVRLPPDPPPAPSPSPEPPVAEPPPTGRPPTTIPVPAALPMSVASLVRAQVERPAAEPVRDVVDVQQVAATAPPAAAEVVQTTTTVVAAEPSVTAATNAEGPSRPGPAASGSPLHGALPAGRTVVYVLDCSGTMGLGGKLARARAALLATLADQPAGVRVLVVAYSGQAKPLTTGGPTEVSVAVRARIADALERVEAGGASRHADGVRVALKFDPDYVVLLTDADDAELTGVRPVVAGARRPVSASAARVTGDGVEPPRAVR